MRYLCHVMQQAESSRDKVRRRKNSCLRDAFVFLLWHTSRHQLIAVIGGRCRSRADNLQPGTVEAGRVTPCAQEPLAWSQCVVELVTSAAPGVFRFHETRVVAANVIFPRRAANSTPSNPLIEYEGSIQGEGKEEEGRGKKKRKGAE